MAVGDVRVSSFLGRLCTLYSYNIVGYAQAIWETQGIAEAAYKYAYEASPGAAMAEEYAEFLRDVKHDNKAYEQLMASAGLLQDDGHSASQAMSMQQARDICLCVCLYGCLYACLLSDCKLATAMTRRYVAPTSNPHKSYAKS